MCFAIPYKVLKVGKDSAIVEGNKTVKVNRQIKIKKGDYLRVIGDITVEKLSEKEGIKTRQMIKRLYNKQ